MRPLARAHPMPGTLRRRLARWRARWLPNRVLFHWRIGTRLLALMLLAALLALWLGASGLRGMASAVAELQRVHDERMAPVRSLSRIAQLMQSNQHQLQLALARVPNPPDSAPRAPLLSPEAARASAAAIARNAQQITALWHGYAARLPAEGQEALLAARFAAPRDAYLREGIDPALAALRTLDLAPIAYRAERAQQLYQRAEQGIQALIELQFTLANATYEEGMAHYARTRNQALLTLALAVLLLGLLGWGQIRAIVLPLRQVRAVFQRIARGQLETPITVPGRDEISALLQDLALLQQRLAHNEREIGQLIDYDPLTSLPNRRLLRERIAQALAQGDAPQQQRALLLLDLDHFKNINDTQGHEVGDQYLQEAARRLSMVAQPPHFVARIGGDEFVVLTAPLGAEAGPALARAQDLARRLLRALSAPWQAQAQEHHGSASVGLYLFHPGQATIAELLKCADLAMYQAKSAGRNQLCVFNPRMQTQLQ